MRNFYPVDYYGNENTPRPPPPPPPFFRGPLSPSLLHRRRRLSERPMEEVEEESGSFFPSFLFLLQRPNCAPTLPPAKGRPGTGKREALSLSPLGGAPFLLIPCSNDEKGGPLSLACFGRKLGDGGGGWGNWGSLSSSSSFSASSAIYCAYSAAGKSTSPSSFPPSRLSLLGSKLVAGDEASCFLAEKKFLREGREAKREKLEEEELG